MAPSSAPRFATSPPLHLHWQLLSYHIARPKLFLHFDVASSIHDIEYRQNSLYGVQRIPLSDVDLDKPATDKNLRKMIINFQRDPFEWDIHVEREEGIRVRDVFEAIHTFLNFPLTLYESSLMPPRLLAGLDETYRLRCNLAPVHPIPQQHEGWKRVDALLHETIFCGLTQSKSGHWILHLSGAMPNVINRRRLISGHMGADRLPLNSKFDLKTTASNSLPPPPVSDLPDEYLPPYPNQTPNALPEYSNIDLFNLPLSAAFVSTGLDSDVMLPLWNACRICNFVSSSPIHQHGTLCNVLKNIPPLIREHSSQDYTWAFFCRFVPLCALFDSPGQGPPPMIQLGSDRDRLIERLEADFKNPRNDMWWLHGPSGTGKSVIAYTLASRCKQKHRLAGSFFFSRRHTKCRSARSVVLALSYQLGLSQPQAKEKIIATLDSDPGIISPSRDLREQFARLLVEPLEVVDWLSPSRVFVIDAMDQCQDHAPELISLLTRLLSHLADVGLQIFFTSRDDVQGVLIKRHLLPIMSDIALDRIDITLDVRLSLRQSFDKIHKRHRLQCRKPWPPDEVLDCLVDRVGPHFITGSVIVKFVDSPDHDPADRMDLIYHLPLNSSSHSESSVDNFYKSIISTADDLEQAYLHLTVVVNLADMLSCSQLHNLLNRGPNQTFDMCSVLSQLSPLVHIPDGHDSTVQVVHESLYDFLSNPLRCGEQFISQAAVHRLLAYSSLSVMIEKLPDDSTLYSRLSRLTTESGSVSLGAFDNVEDLSYAISSPPEPLPFWSTLWHIMQNQYTGLQAESRTKLDLQYFCRTWQILQHLDLSTVDTLPAFRFLANIRSLPVLLAFPIFLAFESPRYGETLGPSTLEHDPRIETLDAVAEIVNDVHALNERKTGSGALDYACTHWAYHLSLAEWDDDLRSLLTSFMEQKLQQWLVKAWCLQDLETCLRTLCEVQEFCLTAIPPIRFDSDVQRTTASTEAEEEAERAGGAKRSVKEEVESVIMEGVKRTNRTAEEGEKRVDEVIAETEVERKTSENDIHKTAVSKEEADALSGVDAGSRYSIQDDLPHGVFIGRGGCWTCRLRRKKCDEQLEGNSCYTCKRLRIECLGWGTKRPEWIRDKKAVEDYKIGIKARLTRSGLIRGQPKSPILQTSAATSSSMSTPSSRIIDFGISTCVDPLGDPTDTASTEAEEEAEGTEPYPQSFSAEPFALHDSFYDSGLPTISERVRQHFGESFFQANQSNVTVNSSVACSVCGRDRDRFVILKPCEHPLCLGCLTSAINIVGEKAMQCAVCEESAADFQTHPATADTEAEMKSAENDDLETTAGKENVKIPSDIDLGLSARRSAADCINLDVGLPFQVHPRTPSRTPSPGTTSPENQQLSSHWSADRKRVDQQRKPSKATSSVRKFEDTDFEEEFPPPTNFHLRSSKTRVNATRRSPAVRRSPPIPVTPMVQKPRELLLSPYHTDTVIPVRNDESGGSPIEAMLPNLTAYTPMVQKPRELLLSPYHTDTVIPVRNDESGGSPIEAMLPNLTAYITKDDGYPAAGSAFGNIWKCTYSIDWSRIKVAVKELRWNTTDQIDPAKIKRIIMRALSINAKLKHKNILPVYGYTYGFGPFIALVRPWAENGNLTVYLERVGAGLTVFRRFQILRDVIAGLRYLHANSVIHGNLNGHNVLIHGDGTACVAGLGLSSIYSEVIGTLYGNVRWMAPELLAFEDEDGSPLRQNEQSDIYSFGGIMLQVLTNSTPYHHIRNNAIIWARHKSEMPSQSHFPPLPKKYWEFIEQCWSSDPRERPSTEAAYGVIRDEYYALSRSP